MKRTNIMLGDDQHKKLKDYARREGRTLGDLVREAIDSSYKRKDRLEERRRVALSAYAEGFISLGKLAEVLGLDPVSARSYLLERRISPRVQDLDALSRDARNA